MKELLRLFTFDTQQYRIMKQLIDRGVVETWWLSSARPLGGAGCSQYNARIKEIREAIRPKGWVIRSEDRKRFYLERFEDTNGQKDMF